MGFTFFKVWKYIDEKSNKDEIEYIMFYNDVIHVYCTKYFVAYLEFGFRLQNCINTSLRYAYKKCLTGIKWNQTAYKKLAHHFEVF